MNRLRDIVPGASRVSAHASGDKQANTSPDKHHPRWKIVLPLVHPRQSGGTIGWVIDYFCTKPATVIIHARAIPARHHVRANFATAH
jgi:hypothetical protein